MIRWLRVVLPPWWAVLPAVFFYIGLDVFTLCAEWRVGAPFYSLIESKIFVATMAVFVVPYVIYRVWVFHPALRPDYYSWLLGTPWMSRKPLPLGPVHLVLQDVLLLFVVIGLCWPRCGTQSLALLKVLLTSYVIVLGYLHVYTGQKAWAYAVGVGLGFMGLLVFSPLFYVAAGITYFVAFLGLRASLAHFPWDNVPQFQKLQQALKGNPQSQRKGMLGWPFERLGPGFSSDNQFTLTDAILTGLLVGWWCFVVAYLLSTHNLEIEITWRMSSFFLVGGVICRIVIYCHGYAPPLSLRGRIALGQLIIAGYDQVFVAPILATLVFLAARMLHIWIGISDLIVLPIAVTAMWWILFGMGPSLNAWRLTGNHRIVKGLLMLAPRGQQNR